MKLRDIYQGGVYEYDTRSLVWIRLLDASGGQIEEVLERINMLAEMVAKLIDLSAATDAQKIEIIGLFGFELVKDEG
jgi:hypothetical protein